MKLRFVLEDDAVNAELARVWPWWSEVVRVAIEHAHAGSKGFVRNRLAKSGHEACALTIHLSEELLDAFVF